MTNPTQAIPMVDLRSQYHNLKSEIDTALADVLESTAFIFGPNVHALEQEIASYLKCKHAVSCSSGTDALHLALRALDLNPGDEIITPSFTFAATAEAIRYIGATPVFVDIDPVSFNLEPECIANAVTDKTRAIIVVHLFGNPVDLNAIKQITADKNIYLIEDCAQSFGGSYNNKKTGTFGDVACYSFFPSKNLGCYGDGGLVSTNNDAIAEKVKLLRNHGSPERYQHTVIGWNSRLDEIQAAILRIKLKHIDQYNESRRAVASRYSQLLDVVVEQTPTEIANGYHVYHQYTVLVRHREKIQTALSEQKIASAIYYPTGLHQQPAFKDFANRCSLPHTESVSALCLSLPIYPELSLDTVDTICEVFHSAAEV